MKSIKILLLVLASSVMMQSAHAQCSDRQIKKLCKEGLGSYIFESAAFKPLSAFNIKKNTIEAAFSVYSQESYRLLQLSSGFSDPVEFSIYDADRNLLFSSSKEKGAKHYDFVAQKSGDYTIEFKVPGADANNANACVAFAIGYK
jgi:hypothetical protein